MTNQMFDLYWLAYLLTGDSERSMLAIIETLDLPDPAKKSSSPRRWGM